MPVQARRPKFSEAEARVIYSEAHAAAQKAAEEVVPVPMHVVERANPLDDSSPIVKRYAPVMEGPCGFASVRIFPGNSSFANHLKKRGLARPAYGGGVSIWVSAYGQSLMRKSAYAEAFAAVLQSHGIDAFGESRMD